MVTLSDICLTNDHIYTEPGYQNTGWLQVVLVKNAFFFIGRAI